MANDDSLIHDTFPSQGTEQPTYQGSQSQAPASSAVRAVDEAESYRMSRGEFQQAATLESNKQAYKKRMGLK